MFKVLAIDGGGVRGIYPASFLLWFETQSQICLHNYFDLVVGTSTGGIIALALAAEIPLSKVVELYSTKASKVFKPRRWNPWSVRVAKYANDELIKELKSIFGRSALKDLRCPVCIPSIDLVTGRAKIFRPKRSEPDHEHTESMAAWQAAAGTSAAPTYFPAFKFESNGIVTNFADGGLWANNPTLVGIEEALARGAKFGEIDILSLSTGNPVFETPAHHNFGGLMSWRDKIVDIAFLAQAQGTELIIRRLCGTSYCRINEVLPSKQALDDLSVIPTLRKRATEKAQSVAKELLPRFFTHRSERSLSNP